MKKNKGNQAKPKIQTFTEEELVLTFQKTLSEWNDKIREDVKYEELRQKTTLLPSGPKNYLRMYLNFLAEHTNDRFHLKNREKYNQQMTSKNQRTLKSIMLESGLFPTNKEIRSLVSVSPGGLETFSFLEASIQDLVIIRLLIYSHCYIPLGKEGMEISLKEVNRSQYGQLRYYTSLVAQKVLIVVSMGFERVPVWHQKTKGIHNFQINFCVTLEKIVDLSKQKEQDHHQIVKNVVRQMEKIRQWDVRYMYSADDLNIDESLTKGNVLSLSLKSNKNEEHLVQKMEPIYFKPIKSSSVDSLDYFFKYDEQMFYQEWLLRSPGNRKERKEEDFNYESVNYSHAKNYVNFLSEIPNFKFKLTNQQIDVVGENGNLIVIGRSGTGKTLLSILRLYSMDFLRKQASIESKIETKQISKRCVYLELERTFEEKNVFLTASSHLIEEIMRQYNDMHYQILAEHKKNCVQCEKVLDNEMKLLKNDDIEEVLQRIEARESINCAVSLLQKEDFPEFFTVKTMINIIDSGLKRPFFNVEATRKLGDKKGKMINIYYEGLYRTYTVYEDLLKMCFKQKLEKYTDIQLKERKQEDGQIEMMEVDYRYFARSIWPKISKSYFQGVKREKNRLNCSVVWAEIFSIIKGSVKAHTTHLKCLSPGMYIEESKSPFLSLQQKTDIYHLFEQYQNYKISYRYYDFMDLVNHVLQEVHFGGYTDEKLDSMFIDEVQDLTPAMIYLLTKMTKKNNFYCGDTAQAISKGVSFKFSEIKSLFSKKYFKHAVDKEIQNQEKHLTVNFRSHNRILMLANAVVAMMKELFPKTIDVLKEERSDLIGPHNYLIQSGDQRIIYDLLLGPAEELPEGQVNQMPIKEDKKEEKVVEIVKKGKQKEKKVKQKIVEKQKKQIVGDPEEYSIDEEEDFPEEDIDQSEQSDEQSDYSSQEESVISLSELQKKEKELMTRSLTSQQVVLVRNQEQMQKLPNFIEKEHKLTCQEVKGLQYQDVIIYNFFSSSPCLQKWSLLDYLDIQQKYVSVEVFESQLSRRSVEEGRGGQEAKGLDEEVRIELGFDAEKNMYRVYEVKTNGNYMKIDIKEFHEIASQLKLFYTLLTRAKNTVVIFDRKIPRQLSRFFKNMDLVKIIAPDQVSKQNEQIQIYRQRESNDRYINKNRLWQEQALKMLVRKNYDEAIRGFEKAGNIKNVKRVQAIKIEKEAEEEMHEIQVQLGNPDKLSRQEFRLKKMKLEKEKNKINQRLEYAGRLYQSIQLYDKAGSIFTNTSNHQKAIECFSSCGNNKKLADSFFKIQNYERALKFYKLEDDMNGQLDCYIHLKRWGEAFQLMTENKSIAKEKLKNNEEFKTNTRYCMKKMLDALCQSQQVKGQIHFNQGFSIPKQRDKEQQIGQKALEQSNKNVRQKMSEIYQKYSQFELGHMQAELKKKQEEWKEFNLREKTKRGEKEKVETLSEELFKIQKSTKTKIKKTTKKIQQMGFSILDIADLTSNAGDIEIITSYKQSKGTLDKIRQQQKQLSQNLITLEAQVEQLDNIREVLESRSDFQDLSTRINAIQFLKEKLQEDFHGIQKKQISVSLQHFESSFIDQDSDLTSSYSGKRSFMNTFYKIWLSDDTVSSVLNEAESIIDLSSDLMANPPMQFVSIFNHKWWRNKLENEMLLDNKSTAKHAKIIRVLSSLNCTSVGFVLCDYEGLPYQLPELILKTMLSYSRNFFNKRKVKEVTNIIVNEVQNENILNQGERLLSRLGEETISLFELKKATKQITFRQSILDDLMVGFILMGFANNTIPFLKEEQRMMHYYMFFDYETMVRQIALIQKNRYREKQREQYKYYFLDLEKQGKFQERYRNLYNIYSIQKLFFDHDQCSDNPILSKPYEIDQIELDDKELIECRQEVDMIINNNQSQEISNKKLQLQNLHQIRQKERTNYYFAIGNLEYQKRENKESIRKLKNEIHKENLNIRDTEQKLYYLTEKSKHTIQADLFKWGNEKKRSQAILTKIQQDHRKENNDQKRLDDNIEYRRLIQIFERAKRQQKSSSLLLQRVQNMLKKRQFHKSKRNNWNQEIKTFNRLIQTADSQILQCGYKIDKRSKQLDLQEKKAKNFIEKWQSKNNIHQEEGKIVKAVIFEMKKKKVNQMNRQKKNQIKNNIERKSNLVRTEYSELNLLKVLIYSKFDRSQIKRKGQTRQALIKTLNLMKERNMSKLKNHEIAMVIVAALSFLFNDDFRDACLKLCEELHNQFCQSYSFIQQNKRIKMGLTRQIQNCQQKIQSYNKKLTDPGVDIWKKSFVKQQQQYFQVKIRENHFKIAEIDENAKRYGLDNFSRAPCMRIADILSIFSLLQNVSEANFNFIEILFGFFQCRVIRNSQMLSFLGKQYVFVHSDSVILKKMLEENRANFGYYFDCHNKIVLATFQDVHRAILKYLEKQQQEVYSKIQWMKNEIREHTELLKTDIRAKFIEKQVLGVNIAKESEAVYKTKLQLATRNEKDEVKKLYNDYKEGKMLNKARMLKRQVLQFYLSNELKQKESFFFALFQLKEYYNVEQLLTKMTFFNPKLLRELQLKLNELEKEKVNWIKKDRFKGEQANCLLVQQT